MADENTLGNEPSSENPKFDQEFFLALAAKGKDAWNAWRRDPANKDVRVTFAGVDFSEAAKDQISFEGFEFGEDADFSNCKWRGAKGTGHEGFLPGRAYFINTILGNGSIFINAAFGSLASFAGAHFGHLTFFSGATFGGLANFTNAIFLDAASFDDTSFGVLANFGGTSFGMGADFRRAVFRDP